MQQYADIYLLQSHYMFRVSQHPSSGVLKTNRNLWYSYFPPMSPDQATEGSSCTSIMTCTGGCGYSF